MTEKQNPVILYLYFRYHWYTVTSVLYVYWVIEAGKPKAISIQTLANAFDKFANVQLMQTRLDYKLFRNFDHFDDPGQSIYRTANHCYSTSIFSEYIGKHQKAFTPKQGGKLTAPWQQLQASVPIAHMDKNSSW